MRAASRTRSALLEGADAGVFINTVIQEVNSMSVSLSRGLLGPFAALLLSTSCVQPAAKKSNSNDAPAATKPAAIAASEPAPEPQSTPDSAPTKPDDLKLAMTATAPVKEPTPITPQKTDPECEGAASVMSDTDKDALLAAYIEIQKDYLAREKGVKNPKLSKDPKDPLRYELAFTDIFGNNASMKYKFGKAIPGKDGAVTLCLDEGAIMLWAGTYKRDATNKFVPDL
jgi:hypothetical protein